MRLARPFALIVAAVAFAACASAAPGWTYAPAPSVTSLPSVAPDASGGASAAPSPAASGEAPSGTVIDISAQGIAYDKSDLTVPAGQPFQIRFANNDAGIPHNVAIQEGSPTGAEVWKGAVFNGIETRTYDVPALTAGTYGFVCSVHPTMIGTLTAN